MGKGKEKEDINPSAQRLQWFVFSGIVVVMIVVAIAMYLSLANSISKIDAKIELINNSLELETDDHYIEVQNEVQKSVVVVRGYPAHSGGTSLNNVIYTDANNLQWNQGAGFSFDEQGNILTAYHIIDGAETVDILLPNNNGQRILVGKSKNFPELDLAILWVNSTVPPVQIQDVNSSNDAIKNIGSSVGFIGFPISMPYAPAVETTNRGTVSGSMYFPFRQTLVPIYIIGGSANPGNSGGPVFSLKTGKVIGIINAGPVGTQGIVYSTAISKQIINTLLTVPVNETPSQ